MRISKRADPIVVTGMGVMTPIGTDVNAFHEALVRGDCGIRTIDFPWPTGYQVLRAGIVPDGADAANTSHRASRLAVATATAALSNADLAPDAYGAHRIGVVAGTTLGDAHDVEAGWLGGRPVDDTWARIGHLADRVAQATGVAGEVHLVSTTCAAGNHALAWCAQLLEGGRADATVAVAADTVGFADMLGFTRLLLQAPERCQPFDLHRKGTILSEGAAALVLERASDARARGASILAELAGWGSSCDAAGPFASRLSNRRGMEVAFRRALSKAQLPAEAIDHVSAHGSATKLNDHKETLFLKSILGTRANSVPVSGIKGALGHAQGAAAMIEAVACVLSLTRAVVYPTINYDTPDPHCDLDYVPNEAREHRVNVVLSNAFGVGGNNTLVIFRRWED